MSRRRPNPFDWLPTYKPPRPRRPQPPARTGKFRCSGCGAVFNCRLSSIGTVQRCRNCGAKSLVVGPPGILDSFAALGSTLVFLILLPFRAVALIVKVIAWFVALFTKKEES